jgi:hypothetical protein
MAAGGAAVTSTVCVKSTPPSPRSHFDGRDEQVVDHVVALDEPVVLVSPAQDYLDPPPVWDLERADHLALWWMGDGLRHTPDGGDAAVGA